MVRHIKIIKLLFPVLIFLMITGTAFAVQSRWDVIIMHPKDVLSSGLYAIENGQSVGYVKPKTTIDQTYRAALWKNKTSDCTILQQNIPSTADDISDGKQVGYASNFAYLWDGGATDGTPLLLPNKTFLDGGMYQASIAVGISKGWQAGEATEATDVSHYSRAVLWHGANEIPTVLHFGEATSNSSIQGIYGASASSPGFQVGYQEIFDGEAYWNKHAILWSGTAESHIDLNPSGAKQSEALRGYGSQQVGYATFDNKDQAILWNGSAAKYVNLHPSCADKSYAASIYGSYQVGYVYRTGDSELFSHAWLWEGSAEKYVDLHELLPPEYIFSKAFGVEVVGGHVYVVGAAYNYQAAREEAVMWHFTPFGPMIWANGQSGTVDIQPNQGFSISTAFSAGASESDAVDWWFILYDKDAQNYYYLDDKGKWGNAYNEIRACRPFYTGQLFSFGPVSIYDNIKLPPKNYTFSFGISWPSTGILEGGVLMDSVVVNVKSN